MRLVPLDGNDEPSSHDALPAIGEFVPALTLPRVGGGSVSLRESRTTPALVVLWSARCLAAEGAIEAVRWLAAEYGPSKVAVLVLADSRGDASSLEKLAGVGPGVQVALADQELSEHFARRSLRRWKAAVPLPSFLLLDTAGRIAYRQVGIESAPGAGLRRVAAMLDRLLAE